MKMEINADLMLVDRKSNAKQREADERQPLVLDLKFHGEVKIEKLKKLYGTPGAYEAALENLYTPKGELKAPDIGYMTLINEANKCIVEIKSVGGNHLKFSGAELDKIRIAPLTMGRAEVTLRVRVTVLEADDDGTLGQLLGYPVALRVSGQQAELDFNKGKDADEDEGEESDEGGAKPGKKAAGQQQPLQ